MLFDRFVPKGIPKSLIVVLIVANLLLGASGMRYGGLEGILHTLENWLVLLVIIPASTALLAMPQKYREPTFDLKMAYYLGMFVAFLFMFGKLRYWH